jgi:serine/threonine protein kinase
MQPDPQPKKKFLRSNPTPEHCLADFILRQIGKGTFGVVYKAVHKSTMRNYAIKQIFKQGNELTIHHELTVMYSLDCPHIVRLYDHFEDDVNVYLVLELVEGVPTVD